MKFVLGFVVDGIGKRLLIKVFFGMEILMIGDGNMGVLLLVFLIIIFILISLKKLLGRIIILSLKKYLFFLV